MSQVSVIKKRPLRLFVMSLLLVTFLSGLSVRGVAQTPPGGQAPSPAAIPDDTLALQRHGEHSLLKLDDYEYLLDVLFPIDHTIPLGLDYTIVLRFEPHLHPESQVVMRRWHDGHVDATIQQVIAGNAWRSAYSQITPGQPLDFPTLAAAVQVRESKLKITAVQVQAWHDAMFPALEQQFLHVRSADREIARGGKFRAESTGTRYQLWFIQQNNEVHAAVWDTEVEALPTGSLPLTKWMNQVRFYAANHWVSKAPPAQTAPAGPAVAAPTPQPAPAEPMAATPPPHP